MSSNSQPHDPLPLLYRTPDSWANAVLKDPLALLSDHAYLERKAASNALEMLNRWPEPKYPKGWIETLSSVAQDEASHLHAVTRLLTRRRGKLERLHKNPYANELRKLVRTGRGPLEILDRLLVSALIEARSCERFGILARRARDPELAQLYHRLYASEIRHYKVFLKLGKEVFPASEFNRRWKGMLEAEAKIMKTLVPGGHSLLSGFSREPSPHHPRNSDD